jgi:hypothetical protein
MILLQFSSDPMKYNRIVYVFRTYTHTWIMLRTKKKIKNKSSRYGLIYVHDRIANDNHLCATRIIEYYNVLHFIIFRRLRAIICAYSLYIV